MFEKINNLNKKFLKIFLKNKFEKILFIIAVICAGALFLTQIGMISNTLRPFLSDVEVFEGKYIKEIDSLIKEGRLTLELVDMSKEHDIKVLVNGIETAHFYDKFIDIKVKDDSIVEIDGSKIKSSFSVKIVSKSDNIKSDLVGKAVTLQSNIKVLARIKVS